MSAPKGENNHGSESTMDGDHQVDLSILCRGLGLAGEHQCSECKHICPPPTPPNMDKKWF